jgi:hypothetical protein
MDSLDSFGYIFDMAFEKMDQKIDFYLDSFSFSFFDLWNIQSIMSS